MHKYAIIVAGGAGVRMGTSIPKQFLLLSGKPVLWHTLTAFLSTFSDLKVILVLPEQYLETGRAIIGATADPSRVQVATGGQTRYHSVWNGLQLIRTEGIIFVHDGVRCLVTPELIRRCYQSVVENGNAVPAVSAPDSMRFINEKGNEALDRSRVRMIQTPQAFTADILRKAFEQPYEAGFTDEATAVEKTGVSIQLVEGESTNIKITTPIDIQVAEKILEERASALQNRPGQ